MQSGSLQIKNDADRLERAQRRAMKKIKVLENPPYNPRLNGLVPFWESHKVIPAVLKVAVKSGLRLLSSPEVIWGR